MINKTHELSSQNRDNYAQLHGSFQWHVPDRFNMAQVCSARWAASADAAENTAICEYYSEAGARSYSFAQLQRQANQLSNLLAQHGVKRGDRVAIVMPQRFETAVAYMAVLQMGAVAMPLSMLFGPDALEFRLMDSEAVLAICDDCVVDSLRAVQVNCSQLRAVLSMSAIGASHPAQSNEFDLVDTSADEAAVLIYTSGTTGPPKGALIPHRALIGNLTGFVCSQNWFGFDGVTNAQSDAVFWSPADWAWTGGLMDALLPTLYFGRPIVAFNGRFSPELAFSLMQQHGVTHSFLFPTALKAMMKAYPQPHKHFKLKLEGLMSAGEAVGDAVARDRDLVVAARRRRVVDAADVLQREVEHHGPVVAEGCLAGLGDRAGRRRGDEALHVGLQEAGRRPAGGAARGGPQRVDDQEHGSATAAGDVAA